MFNNEWTAEHGVIHITQPEKSTKSFSTCAHMGGPRGYYAKLNKSDREGQMPYGFTYMWNLKNKINEQTKLKQTHRQWTDSCQRGGGRGRTGENRGRVIKEHG